MIQAPPRAQKRPLLRPNPSQPDQSDGERLAYANYLIESQTNALIMRDRQIEENLRMLAGQQWHFYSERYGRWVDVREWMTEDERLWRARPVLNRLLPIFMLIHARMTENPPIVGWLPGPDRVDQELAELLDTLMKVEWRRIGMVDVLDRLFSWLLPSGEAYLYSRIDPFGGELQPWTGQATVPLEVQAQGPDGAPTWQPLTGADGQPLPPQPRPDVPFDKDGQPSSRLTPSGWVPIDGTEQHAERTGQITVDVFSALQVRGEWGPTPWEKKAWHSVDRFLSPEEVLDTYGVEVQADVKRPGTPRERVLFGAGYFGSSTHTSAGMTLDAATMTDGLVLVRELWERPSQFPGMAETASSPGGRLLITAPLQNKVLRDGPRPVRYRYTSPLRQFQFVRLPGRPSGTSPFEFLNSPQRSENRVTGQILEHGALMASPKKIAANGSGLEHIQITNRPDETYFVNQRPGVKALEYVTPPALGQDIYRAGELLRDFMQSLGNTQSAAGEAPSADPSAKLVQELRFDRDRFLGPTLRRATEEIGRMQEDWSCLFPLIYTDEQIISYAGEDNIARTLYLRPHLFEQGRADAVPAPESMLPESRGERQSRVRQLYMDGAFGPPATPEANERYLELAQFPNLSRVNQPGGEDRTMAEHNLGRILKGAPASEIVLYPWYNYAIHKRTYEKFMKRPEFLALDQQVQGQFVLVWQNVNRLFQQQMMAMAPPPGPDGPGAPSPDAAPTEDQAA